MLSLLKECILCVIALARGSSLTVYRAVWLFIAAAQPSLSSSDASVRASHTPSCTAGRHVDAPAQQLAAHQVWHVFLLTSSRALCRCRVVSCIL